MQNTSTLVIGAGLTGLSCAYHLQRDYLLLEKENEPGGVVRTRNRHNGFLCDGTGHWLHLRTPVMQRLVQQLLAGQLVEYERKAVIHSHGVFTPYPFQANTYGLPAQVVYECLIGLLKARHPEDFGASHPATAPQNFREWIERYFGEGIAKHFMIPYNEKLLGVDLRELRPEYAERFIPRPSVDDVIKGAVGLSRESLGYNARFVYPREGGISTLPRTLAQALQEAPRFNTAVVQVELGRRVARLADGGQVQFQHLVNTMALPQFVQMISDAPAAVRAAAARLRATTVHYYDLGVRGPGAQASQHHWIYFPEPDFIFYRTGSYSAVHAGAAPDGCRSYYVEMSGGAREWLSEPEKLRARVLADLRKAQVLSERDEIIFMELCRIPHAYVVFDQHYEASRQLILDYLAEHQAQSCGRWGGWNYGGMEDALLEGRRAADQVLNPQ
ncbi:MAG TPA: FAD-dependent oxidoreductase [Verrucomicrobiota bacterium]|nr:FAD-dependent oxidoreductase [Verrucomicrobiota bacterium]HNT13510.1 FAD-dependent oxidoreductase [Verrucomicrobiota bacterium]